jgi:ABC-2 type transport system permease protein
MKKIVDYWKLYFTFFGYSLNRELQFRTNFIVVLIGYIFYLAANLSLFGVIYKWTDNLGGWTFYEALIFLGTYHMIHGLWDFSTALNLDRISEYVGDGTLDLILIKPISSLYFVLFRNMNFPSFINVILGIILTITGTILNHSSINIGIILIYIILAISGVIIFTMIQLLIQLISFWVIKTYILNSVFYQIIKFAEKPDVIFGGLIRYILMFIVPMLVIVNFPSRLLMGKLNWQFVCYDVLVTGIFIFLGIMGWRLALKAYSSASS